MIDAMIASWSESGKRSRNSSVMGAPVHIEVPKSNRTIPVIQTRNCFQSGWSRPSRARSVSRFSFCANALSPAKRSSTRSPGTIRIRKKMITATPSSVGIIRSTRLTMYLPTAARALLAEPDRVELVVQVVARSDGPALDLRAVGDDPVPLERVEVVRLLLHESPLEFPDVLLALLRVNRAALLLVELVQHRVRVAAVVRRALVLGLELVEVEVGLHDVAALEVHRHVEVTAAELRIVLGRFDHLLLDVQTDLPPLVDQPDSDGLVRHGDSTVLEGEREPVGDAGLVQEPPGLSS